MLLLITLSPRLTLAMVLLLRTLGLLIPRLSSRMTALLWFRLIHPLVRLTMLLQMAMCLMTLLSITLNLLLTQITLLAAVLLLLYNIRTMNRLSENPMIRIHLLAMSAALRMLALLMWMLRPWMVTLLQWKLRHLQVTLKERSILMTKRQAMLALTMLNLLLTLAALPMMLLHPLHNALTATMFPVKAIRASLEVMAVATITAPMKRLHPLPKA